MLLHDNDSSVDSGIDSHAKVKRDPLTVTRGLMHDYLGMSFDRRTKGEIALSQYDYIKKMHMRLTP